MSELYKNKIITFFGSQLYIDDRVYVPTVETEILVMNVVHFLQLSECSTNSYVLDVGTGSGALAIAIAKCFPSVKVVGVDVATEALEVADINKKNNKITNIDFVQSNMLSELSQQPYCIIADLPWGSEEYLLGSNQKRNWAEMPDVSFFPKEGGPMGCYKQLVDEILAKDWETTLFIETGVMDEDLVRNELPENLSLKYLQYTNYSVTKIIF